MAAVIELAGGVLDPWPLHLFLCLWQRIFKTDDSIPQPTGDVVSGLLFTTCGPDQRWCFKVDKSVFLLLQHSDIWHHGCHRGRRLPTRKSARTFLTAQRNLLPWLVNREWSVFPWPRRVSFRDNGVKRSRNPMRHGRLRGIDWRAPRKRQRTAAQREKKRNTGE